MANVNKSTKLKTHKGAKKRMHATAGGHFLRTVAGKQHKQEAKSGDRRRRLRGTAGVDRTDEQRAARLLPYA